MTPHSAKGLEFPIVFLIGMEEGVSHIAVSIMDEEEMEEEKKIGVCWDYSRAENELYITNAEMRTLYGRTDMNPVSRFISEIPEELLESENPKRQLKKRTAFGEKRPPVTRSQANAAAQLNWKVGDKVMHKKWGTGTVVAVKGSGDSTELDIAFPSPTGIKRLLAQSAPIEKA